MRAASLRAESIFALEAQLALGAVSVQGKALVLKAKESSDL